MVSNIFDKKFLDLAGWLEMADENKNKNLTIISP